MTPIKRLVLVVSEKGGVGKSVFTRTLGDILRDEGVRVAIYDADGSIGSTLRVLGSRDASGSLIEKQNPIEGVGFYAGRTEKGLATLINSLTSKENLYLHDLAGGNLEALTRLIDKGKGLTGFLDMIEAQGYRLTLLHIINPDIAASQSVGTWLDLVGDRADHVAVVNTAWGETDEALPYWYGFTSAAGEQKGGKARARLLALGGLEIEFPALQVGTFAKVNAENIRVTKPGETAILTLVEQAHVATFVREFKAALTPVRKLLGL